MDKLDEIFQKQLEFQKRVGNIPYKDVQFIKDMTLAAMDELMESLREIPWKPWKKQQEFNMASFKEELIDLLHFFVNLCLAAGMDSNEVHELYLLKNKVNNQRQDEGY